MAISLSKEMAPIPVKVVGGALPGATSMTSAMIFGDLPLIMKIFYPLLKLFVFKEDSGKSAKKCAEPVVWAATQTEMGTGLSLLSAPKVGKFKPEVTNLIPRLCRFATVENYPYPSSVNGA